MSTISFSGLVSGLDSASLIDQLVAAEKSGATTLASRQSDLNTQKSIVGSLSSVLSSLGSLARGMTDASALAPRTASSSDSHISVTASATANVMTHSVRVDSLAAAGVSSSREFATSGAGVAGAGGLSITVEGTTKSISWTASDSLASIASKINDASAGASAAVLFDGTNYRLVVTAAKSGTAADPTFVESGTALGMTVKVPANDAHVRIDGIDITRATNVIDDVVTGVTFTLSSAHALGETASTADITLDRTALKKKLTDFVAAYNSVNSALHVQLDYTGTKKGTNTLFGDSTLRQLQSSLATQLGSEFGGLTLSSVGISRDKTGAMTFDPAALEGALAKDSRVVDKLFSSGGLAASLQTLSDAYTRAGDGAFAAKTKNLESRYKTLQSQIERINSRADAMRSQLEKQFTAMERALSAFQSQSAYISKIL